MTIYTNGVRTSVTLYTNGNSKIGGTTFTYSINAAGDLSFVGYSDYGLTPPLSFYYDRLGLPSSNLCNGITTVRAYDSANDLLGESYSGGVLDGLSVTNGFDNLLRRTSLAVLNSNTPISQYSNSYDAASRLSTVSDGVNSAACSYLANSPLVDHIVFAHGSNNVMTNQNTYDHVNRLTGKSSSLNFAYQYNAASQRTRLTLMDGSYWEYGYDALGQVTSADKYFWDGTPYAGQQFDYAFDTIGNRTGTEAGGDQTGAASAMRPASYTNNALNQIVSRDVPGYVDVMGLSLANNTVTVNGTSAYQKWEYFREQVATNNGSGPQWLGINVKSSGTNLATVSGSVYLPQTPETNFSYDADGNQTSDGRWTYAWDAENRLVSMTSLPNAPIGSQYSLSFAYDYMGRRISKIISTNNGATYVTNIYLYDGWNLIGVLNPQSGLVASMMWGLDLSGSMQGAGGVGGLLAENIAGNGVQFVAYDGNGDVSALVSATNGAVTANYEYGPFGEVIRATGPASKLNQVMYQSQFCDWESGKYYWKYRYFDTSTGQWLSRDPIGEKGEKNLYGFVGNNPINGIDVFGLLDYYYLSQGTFPYPAGPWPYLEADSSLGTLGTGLYNTIPFLYNFVLGPLSRIGTDEGTLSVQRGNGVAMTSAGLNDVLAIAPFVMPESKAISPCARLCAGRAGSFAELKALDVVGDELTPHHMPQAALDFTSREAGGAIMLPFDEHFLTRTYAYNGKVLAQQEAEVPFRTVLAWDIRDLRGTAGSKYDQGIQDLLQYYRKTFPQLMCKPGQP